MTGGTRQSWPITAKAILETLPFPRLIEIAAVFRIPLVDASSWTMVNEALLREPVMQAVPLLYLLTDRELRRICQLVEIGADGPTQRVLAQLLPLCQPSSPAHGGE